MPAAQEKPIDQESKGPVEKDTSGQAKAKASSSAWLVVLLGLINLAAIVAMGLLTHGMWSRVDKLSSALERAKEESAKAGAESTAGQDFKPKSIGVLYPLESFLVNITSDQGPKFLQAQLELELDDPKVEEEVSQKRPAIRDAIIILLSSRSYRDLRDASGVRALRTDLLRSVNGLLSTGKIREIYFTQFHFN